MEKHDFVFLQVASQRVTRRYVSDGEGRLIGYTRVKKLNNAAGTDLLTEVGRADMIWGNCAQKYVRSIITVRRTGAVDVAMDHNVWDARAEWSLPLHVAAHWPNDPSGSDSHLWQSHLQR